MTTPHDASPSRDFGAPADFAGTITEDLPWATPAWPDRPRPDRRGPGGKPDVIVMLVDDMGYSDIGAFGSEIPTPHLDAVAAEGARLTDFHVTPTCSPTRAALLTGCNSHAVGMGAVANVDDGFPGYAAELAPYEPSMAEAFRVAGYATMAIGKWHLCREQDMHAAGDRHSWPLQRGFDQYYGFLEAQANLHAPAQLYEGNSPVRTEEYPAGYYLTDDLTDRAVEMIAETHASDPTKPLMMYYAHAAVHSPMHIKDGAADRFRGRYDAGWEQVRAERRRRQDLLGVIPDAAGTGPMDDDLGPDVPSWDSLTDDARRLAARHMENYAAMVVSIDESVGRIREIQRRLGRLENTIFVFFSDNGAATAGPGGTVGMFNFLANMDRSRKLTLGERVAEEIGRIDELGGPASWPHYASAWATVANTPFRRHKFSTYRGGHQVSCVMSWPAGLPDLAGEQPDLAGGRRDGGSGAVGAGVGAGGVSAGASGDDDNVAARGAVRRQYAHVTDIFPTVAELAGVAVPSSRHGLDARPLDGTSMVAALRDPDAPSAHGDQYYECLGERAYYSGEYELVARHQTATPFSADQWELFRPGTDPVQLENVADQHPEVVADLVARWEAAARENQVYPMSNGSPLHFFQRDPAEERFATETVLVPETPPLERFRSGQLIDGRGFTVEVDLGSDGYCPGDEGVLYAHGGQESGLVLFVEGGHLRVEQNAWGRVLDTASVPAPVPPGAQRLAMRVDAPGRARWVVSLEIDGVAVADGIDLTQLSWLVPFSGLSAGRMHRSPVSARLHREHGMFAYSGRWETVTIRPGAFAPDAPSQLLDLIRTMGAATQ